MASGSRGQSRNRLKQILEVTFIFRAKQDIRRLILDYLRINSPAKQNHHTTTAVATPNNTRVCRPTLIVMVYLQ